MSERFKIVYEAEILWLSDWDSERQTEPEGVYAVTIHEITITRYFTQPSRKLKVLFNLIHQCTVKTWTAPISIIQSHETHGTHTHTLFYFSLFMSQKSKLKIAPNCLLIGGDCWLRGSCGWVGIALRLYVHSLILCWLGDSDQTSFPSCCLGLLGTLSTETNLYADQKQAAKGAYKYRRPTTPQEMKLCIFIQCMFGIHKFPEANLYWSTNPLLWVGAVADVTSQNWFAKISQYFQLIKRQPQSSTSSLTLQQARAFIPCRSEILSSATLNFSAAFFFASSSVRPDTQYSSFVSWKSSQALLFFEACSPSPPPTGLQV